MTTAQPTTIHAYYEVKGSALLGDVDIFLLDSAGTILASTNVTADGLPVLDVKSVVNAQLAIFAGMHSTADEIVTLYRNFDGRAGYLLNADAEQLPVAS